MNRTSRIVAFVVIAVVLVSAGIAISGYFAWKQPKIETRGRTLSDTTPIQFPPIKLPDDPAPKTPTGQHVAQQETAIKDYMEAGNRRERDLAKKYAEAARNALGPTATQQD